MRGGQVLHAVNRDIDGVGQQCPLDFLGEDAIAANLRQGHIAHYIAGRLDFDEFHRTRRGQRPKPVGDEMRLPQRQRAATSTDSQRSSHARDAFRVCSC